MFFKLKHIVCLLLLTTLLGCKGANILIDNYKYTIATQIGNNFSYNYPFILYKNLLIEFELKTTNTVYHSLENNTDSTIITTDTSAMQVINLASKKYVQIDRFRENCIILKHGDYINSTIGIRGGKGLLNLTNSNSKASTNTAFYRGLKDTLLNKVHYKVDFNREKDINGQDSIITITYFYPKPNLISIFNQGGLVNPSKSLCFAGFTTFFCKEKEQISMRLEKIKPLSKQETEVCEKIIQVTGSLLK
jgi:hypothetical protein